jgi:hypothetical protein
MTTGGPLKFFRKSWPIRRIKIQRSDLVLHPMHWLMLCNEVCWEGIHLIMGFESTMTSNSPTLDISIVKPGLFILSQTLQLVLTELSRVSTPIRLVRKRLQERGSWPPARRPSDPVDIQTQPTALRVPLNRLGADNRCSGSSNRVGGKRGILVISSYILHSLSSLVSTGDLLDMLYSSSQSHRS